MPRVELQFLGDDTLDGTPVQRYQVSAEVDGTDVTRTYWVDSDDLLRRLDSTADDHSVAEPSASVAIYDEWGVAVQVEAPDETDVIDVPEGLF